MNLYQHLPHHALAPNESSDTANRSGILTLFWASWCPLCLNKLTRLRASDLAALPYHLLTIASPDHLSERRRDDFEQWWKGSEFKDLPLYLDQDGRFAKALNILSYPSHALWDDRGELIHIERGDMSLAAIRATFERMMPRRTSTQHDPQRSAPNPTQPTQPKRIYLAGGCFWGVEAYMQRLAGVIDTQCGYANGQTDHPSYQDVIHGSGHAETVRIDYDPATLSLSLLLEHFFRIIDPTSVNRQGNDHGVQYRSGIYYQHEADRAIIDRALARLARHHRAPIAIEVAPLVHFYPAEEEHQRYLDKNPTGYCHVNLRLADEPLFDPEAYPTPAPSALELRLSREAFASTQHGATEAPFSHPYHRLFEAGVYLDVSNGEPLFSSADKFDAGCGWPSFYRPISPQALAYRLDESHNMQRIEVLARNSGAHLGHVFNDAPREFGGLRYCINGLALRFVPEADMPAHGLPASLIAPRPPQRAMPHELHKAQDTQKSPH